MSGAHPTADLFDSYVLYNWLLLSVIYKIYETTIRITQFIYDAERDKLIDKSATHYPDI